MRERCPLYAEPRQNLRHACGTSRRRRPWSGRPRNRPAGDGAVCRPYPARSLWCDNDCPEKPPTCPNSASPEAERIRVLESECFCPPGPGAEPGFRPPPQSQSQSRRIPLPYSSTARYQVYLLENTNSLPSGSLNFAIVPHTSFFGPAVNSTPLDWKSLAVAKTSSHQNVSG